jgi:hypothetical protein
VRRNLGMSRLINYDPTKPVQEASDTLTDTHRLSNRVCELKREETGECSILVEQANLGACTCISDRMRKFETKEWAAQLVTRRGQASPQLDLGGREILKPFDLSGPSFPRPALPLFGSVFMTQVHHMTISIYTSSHQDPKIVTAVEGAVLRTSSRRNANMAALKSANLW